MTKTTVNSAAAANLRRAEARRLLVAQVDSFPLRTARSKGTVPAIAAAVFVIGALTGGAIVSATPELGSERNWWDRASSRDAVLQGVSGGAVVGFSRLERAEGVVVANLGGAPDRARAVALAVPCQATGTVILDLKGSTHSRAALHCRRIGSVLTDLLPIGPTSSYRLTVTGGKGRAVVVTWAWADTAASGELFRLRQQLDQTEQEYNEQLSKQCAAAQLARPSCPSPGPSVRP